MPKTQLQPWKTLDSKIIHKTPWIELVEDECLVDNQKLTYTYTRRVDEGPLIIAEEKDQTIWLVRQYRHPIQKIIWQFPVEGKFPNESWAEAAKRGLKEELQLVATGWQNLGQFYVDPGGLSQKYQVYFASNLSKSGDNTFNHSDEEIEHLEIQNFSRKEIDQLIDTGELCDNWTLAGLFLYDRYKQSREHV
jgi:ADP-ribose pyrophosphatase